MALVGCGGGNSGFIIPQETELKPWTAPSEDEILERAGIETAAAEGDEEDFADYEDYADEDADADSDDDADKATPAADPAPAVKPAVKPANKK